MTTYTITTATNIDSLTTKTGGDVYNVNGAVLTIDQDTRYGLNNTTTTAMGNITISSTLGGQVIFDGSNVRLIPYNTGSGNVPAANTTITQGGVTSKLIGVWASLDVAPTAAGAAMPASGFIKVKQKSGGNYAAGVLTGIGATATGADTVGWIEIVGDDAATATVPRLGTFSVTGAWYEVGTTSGTANQTIQLPTSGSAQYFAGVFIEKTASSGDYEFYPNVFGAFNMGADIRAKVVRIGSTGLLRIGHNATINAGYTPPAGLKIVIPNVWFRTCTTAARATNAAPNATLATRYDFTTTGGGVINVDKADLNWYMSMTQAYQITITNTGITDAFLISEAASATTLTKMGVGLSGANAFVAFTSSLNFAGGTVSECAFLRYSLAASGAYIYTETDCSGFTYTDCRFMCAQVKTNATSGAYLGTRVKSATWTGTKLTNGRMVFVTCSNITVTNTSYADVIDGTTTATAAQQSFVYEISTGCSNMVFSGLDFFGLTNVQPYLGVLNVAAAGCVKTRLRNIGTRATPLSLGSVNNSAHLFVLATGAAASDVKVQRCYVSNTRTNLWSTDNSSSNVVVENVAGDYADAPVITSLNSLTKAVGATLSVTAQTAVYGSHFFECFTSTTAGRIGLVMNEKTSVSPSSVSYTVTAGTPKFTSAGGLYMPTIGDQIEFTTPYWIIGHTSFQNLAATMGGGTIGNYTLEYQIDKNNGSGYSIWKTLSGANLSGETGIDAALGFKLKWRITTATTNTSSITSLYVTTNSSTTAQDNQYALDTVTVTLTGLKTGSEVRAYLDSAGANGSEVAGTESSGTSYAFTATAASTINIMINHLNYLPADIWGYVVGSSDVSIPVSQFTDRQYLNA